MATVWDHLSGEELEERFVGCEDASASRHFQVIWLLARGHTISQVSGTTAYGERWIEQLLARYNAEGPEALGDLRRRNGAPATILKPDLLAKLRLRLDDPPPDGGLWSSRKVAAWMAGELNLTSVAPQRGWEALKAIGWSIQKPRPKNPKSATPEEAAAFKKSSRMPLPRRRQLGERPIAHGHHRFDWLYLTAFVSPATGETFWYVSNGVSKEFFEALLETFAREAAEHRATTVLIEDAGPGMNLLQDLRSTMPGGMTRPLGVKPEGSKVDRMAAQSAKIEAGHVYLPKSAAWLGEFLTELLSFPNGRHDDQVDSVSQFLRWLQDAYLNQISFHVPFVVSRPRESLPP